MPRTFKNNVFTTCGQFCSWECVKAHVLKNDDHTTGRLIDLLTLYRKRIYNKIEVLNSAPCRFTLQSFGGTITIDEFRSGRVRAQVSMPHEIHMNNVIHQRFIDGELVLKRSKPLNRDKTSIKSALGINLKK
jgi:hypothetical protein